jgi:Ca2+-binding RTX toxin-like protein
MVRRLAVPAALVLVLMFAAPASAAFPDDGKRWRQVTETAGMTWSQVAAVCPRDGESRCSGSVGSRSLTGWIWATGEQVRALMAHYDPGMLEATSVSGPEHLVQAITFLGDMRPTFFFSGYPTTTASVSGWTADDEYGAAAAGYTHPIYNGSFWVGPGGADQPSPYRGVWLWRPSSDDLTPPVVKPVLSGTLGSNGWYVSDVSVTWDVQDPDSPVTSTSGCEPATVSADTAGTTLTCSATSGGGTVSVPVVVKRDTTRPTVTCSAPVQEFQIHQLGAWATATVTDATSGPARPLVQGTTNTGVAGTFTTVLTGTDRAGHSASTLCTYRVVVPTCNGRTPTIVGNGLNNIINGTAGPDVIVALAGADTVNGNGGDDTICAGDGPDRVYGGDGRDWIDGGASNDDLNGGGGDDFIDGGLHSDSIRGDDGRDTCVSGELRMSSCD